MCVYSTVLLLLKIQFLSCIRGVEFAETYWEMLIVFEKTQLWQVFRLETANLLLGHPKIDIRSSGYSIGNRDILRPLYPVKQGGSTFQSEIDRGSNRYPFAEIGIRSGFIHLINTDPVE